MRRVVAPAFVAALICVVAIVMLRSDEVPAPQIAGHQKDADSVGPGGAYRLLLTPQVPAFLVARQEIAPCTPLSAELFRRPTFVDIEGDPNDWTFLTAALAGGRYVASQRILEGQVLSRHLIEVSTEPCDSTPIDSESSTTSID